MSNKQSSYSEQAEADPVTPQYEVSIGFFAIGIVVNLVLITAYFIWAYKQWKKPGKRDKS
jgi:hypothetical protein